MQQNHCIYVKKQLGILHNFTHLKSIENKNIHRLLSGFFGVTPDLIYFLLCHCQHILYQYSPCRWNLIFLWWKGILDAVSILIFDGLRSSGIEKSNYIESNNLGRKSSPVSGIERIRYSGCLITLKKEGENSGPTKWSGFMTIPVLRGSGLEGFYCTQ